MARAALQLLLAQDQVQAPTHQLGSLAPAQVELEQTLTLRVG